MSSGFISENEAVEIRKKRQEEWERVRTAEDPIERPEEFDRRSLFERLQEQKQKKDLEYEEAHKLKNMIKGLDDDEIDFLDFVDRTKLAADRKKILEEEKELNDFRNRVATLQEKTHEAKLQNEIKNNKRKISTNNKLTSKKVLAGVVVKKSPKNEDKGSLEKKRKVEDGNKTSSEPGLKCIGILPGLGYYNNSSSDESSNSDTDEEEIKKIVNTRCDLLGRKIESKCQKEQDN